MAKHCKHRQNMQNRRYQADVSVEPGNSDKAQHMLATVQSIASTGSYPCPECGTLVVSKGYNKEFGGEHFVCPNPDCQYQGIWGF